MGKHAASTLVGMDENVQLPVESLPAQHWDVIIVGAGPAGCVAAIELAGMGHRVLLADRDWFPRDKVCGDGLTPGAIRILRRLGLYDTVRKVGRHCSEMSVFSPAHVRIDVPGDYITVRRKILDQLMVRKALAAGVTFVRGTADILESQADSKANVHFGEGQAVHTAECCLLATGGRLALAQRAGLVTHPVASGAAVRCYIRSRISLDRLVVACERNILPGYAWIFPVDKDLFNVGCGRFMYGRNEKHVSLRKVFAAFVDEFPLARELLSQGAIETPLKGGVLRSGWQQAGPMARGPFLGMGEMVGTTSPYTGEGIGKAMQSGVLSARLVHRCLLKGEMSALRRYPEYLQQLGGLHYEGFKRTRRWFLQPWLVDFFARRINRSPYLYETFKGILQEKNDPAQVFSCRGVWRSLWH
ncbi:MAG: FAD-dependent monooxygenase [Pedobacter sp.]